MGDKSETLRFDETRAATPRPSPHKKNSYSDLQQQQQQQRALFAWPYKHIQYCKSYF